MNLLAVTATSTPAARQIAKSVAAESTDHWETILGVAASFVGLISFVLVVMGVLWKWGRPSIKQWLREELAPVQELTSNGGKSVKDTVDAMSTAVKTLESEHKREREARAEIRSALLVFQGETRDRFTRIETTQDGTNKRLDDVLLALGTKDR